MPSDIVKKGRGNGKKQGLCHNGSEKEPEGENADGHCSSQGHLIVKFFFRYFIKKDAADSIAYCGKQNAAEA